VIVAEFFERTRRRCAKEIALVSYSPAQPSQQSVLDRAGETQLIRDLHPSQTREDLSGPGTVIGQKQQTAVGGVQARDDEPPGEVD
jgi:hypothetical protein